MPCARPMLGWRLTPSSCSSGRMKGAKMSSISAPQATSSALSSGSTAEFTTIGRLPVRRPAARISSAAARALSRVSTKGMRKVRNSTPENCVSRMFPMVSAVIPVPSEMKNTGRGWSIAALCRMDPKRDNGALGLRPCPGALVLTSHVLWLHQLRLTDLAQVGGKNSSLGEMIGNLSGLGVSVPGGFATTADAFKEFVAFNDLSKRIFDRLAMLDVEDVDALVAAGKQIRGWVIDAPLQPELEKAIRDAYAQLCKEAGAADVAVAVRSSATAADLPDASFAGQQETFLNVVGIGDVLHRIREVFASLY